jgi:hypothetical protein
VAAAGHADAVVAIDCALPGADRWALTAPEIGEAMRNELRDRVAALVGTFTAADASAR